MDCFLENKALGKGEDNRALFANLGNENTLKLLNLNQPSSIDEDKELNIDSYKMYSSFIKEKDGLVSIIHEIQNYVLFPENKENKSVTSLKKLIEFKNRTIMILSSYQEQPGLLDPIIPVIIPLLTEPSLTLIKNDLDCKAPKENFDYISSLYQIIYIICKVRGFGVISKHFSSQVEIFENVIHFLIKQPYEDANSWYVNYVLILWTSILAMVPFNIDTIDSQGQLMNKLVDYLKEELTRSTNLRIVTAYSLSQFLIRPDMIKLGFLNKYFQYSLSLIYNDKENINIFKILGVLLCLCEIFKKGQSKDLIQYIDDMISKILPFKYPESIENSGVFRKTLTKLIQRVGLIILKPKSQKWRYHQTYKKLLGKEEAEKKVQEDETQAEEEEIVFENEKDPEYLETIIDYLLQKLSDKEYIVRWSGAKGLGRICERLSKGMVEDIIQSILDLFKDKEDSEFDWHGACLCLAELCKRGMVLPERLGELVPYLQKALIFETNKGTFCTGSNVRDSACYIIWALARGYSTDIMKNFVDQLAQSLILTILFDKEVNCRRAASAAFQENVGRQGHFPHGIEILTEADYFTLGTRANCYLNIATFICQYDTYYKSIVDYLSFNRLVHIERQIRELAADSLSLLVPFNPVYFINDILPIIIKKATNANLNVRHGCLIGIGNILLGLKGKWDFYHKASVNRKKMLNGLNSKEKKVLEDSEYRKEFEKYYSSIKTINHFDKVISKEQLIKDIVGLIALLDKKGLYRGKGNEMMRYGVNAYLRLLSEAEIPITAEDFLYFHEILIDNIRQSKDVIQEEACDTLRKLNSSYGDKFSDDETVNAKLTKIFDEMITQSVIDDNIHVTNGYTSAIVNFNDKYLIKYYDKILKSLIENSKIKKSKNNDSMTRMKAIESLGYLTCKFITGKKDDIENKIKAIIEGFDDYEMDPKIGDVGSNVRIACIKSILCVMLELYKNALFDIFSKYIIQSLKCVIKQLAEKMASIRRVAGNEMQKFFYELRDVDIREIEKYIPYYTELKNIFVTDLDFDENDNVFNIKWVEPEFAYPKITPIMNIPEYSKCFIEGFIRSISCISEDVQKASMMQLSKMLEQNGEQKDVLIKNIFEVIIDIFKTKEKDDRFIEPLESALVLLFSKSYFINDEYIEYIDKIQKFVVKENADSKNIHKVLYSIDIYLNLLSMNREEKYKIMYRCMRSLLYLMCHRYPVVRRKASEQLFTFLTSCDEPATVIGIDEEAVESALVILSENDWTQRVQFIKETRNSLAECLKIKL